MRRNPKPHVRDFRDDYATCTDFCEVFRRNTTQLYLLAFLLAANHQEAQECFVGAMGKAFAQKNVFKGWEESWSKRCLIEHAIDAIIFQPGRRGTRHDVWFQDEGEIWFRTLSDTAVMLMFATTGDGSYNRCKCRRVRRLDAKQQRSYQAISEDAVGADGREQKRQPREGRHHLCEQTRTPDRFGKNLVHLAQAGDRHRRIDVMDRVLDRRSHCRQRQCRPNHHVHRRGREGDPDRRGVGRHLVDKKEDLCVHGLIDTALLCVLGHADDREPGIRFGIQFGR